MLIRFQERLTVVEFRPGKTTPDRSSRRQTGATDRRDLILCRVIATMSGGSDARTFRGDPRTNRRRPGVGRTTVARLQAAFRPQASAGSNRVRNWGGRRQFLPSREEESAFLKPWLESAATGSLVVVSPIRAALAQRLGQPVKPSVVYRLLARHGWRKVAPDTRHPKSKPEVQAGPEKNFWKCWQPC
jgi:hypothetical protein